MMMCGERGGPPGSIIPGMGDELGGLICAWAVTAALYDREKTGKGQLVDTSKRANLIYTPVQTSTEVFNDPQALANDCITWIDHPV